METTMENIGTLEYVINIQRSGAGKLLGIEQ